MMTLKANPKLSRQLSLWAPSAFEVTSAGRSHFLVEDLLQLAALIARQKEAKKSGRQARPSRGVSRK